MGHFFSRLRVRLLLLVLIAVIPALGMMIYTDLLVRRQAEADANQEALRLARQASTNHTQLIESAHVLLVALARLREVRSGDSVACNALFPDLGKQYPLYTGFGAITPDGNVFCSSLPLTKPVNVADRAYFQRVLKTRGFALGDYQIGRVSGKASIAAAHPVLDAGGRVQAVVIVSLDLAWLNLLATEARLPEGTTLTVIDSTGLILARHPDPQKWVGRSVPEAPVVNAVLAQAREGTVEAPGLDGVRRLYAFTPLGSPAQAGRAYVSVGIPTAVAFAEVNHLLGRNLVGLALVVLLGFAAAWVVSDRFILRHVNALVTATNQLSAGDLSARSGLAREGGELNQLAGAFDDMATALQQRAAEAETAEEALRGYTARLEVLHRIDQDILTAQSPGAVAEAALPQIRNLIPCLRASLLAFDFDKNEAVLLAAHPAGQTGTEPGTRLSLDAYGDIGEILGALRQGRVSTLDISTLTRRPVPNGQIDDVRYFHLAPLIAEGELIGTLTLGVERPEPLSRDYMDVAREVADQLAVAIQQARLREGLQQHAAVLEQRVAHRTVELEKARQEADRANRAKSEFLSRMSHELRTPLNAILGFAQILEMDSLDPEQREAVEDIIKGGRHLLELINEVLDIARVEAGRLAISLEPVAIDEIVEETLGLIRPLAVQMDVRLHDGPVAPAGRHAMADRQRLKQVLLNVLANGIKYNRRGGTVTLSYQEVSADRFRIMVTDTGPGIVPERMERLFIPFERLGAEQTGVEGTGLGLALSKRLVEAMGGTLGVRSTVGQGSTFWVELPTAEGPVQRLEGIERDLPGAVELDASRDARIVLCIEDNLSNVKVIQRLLAHRPEIRLVPTMQGRLGLSLARQHRPHLILLDLHLPDIPGVEVLRQLRADPETAEIPVVVISADATPGQIERLLAAGARAYLTKPLEVKKLFELLNEILQEQPSAETTDLKSLL